MVSIKQPSDPDERNVVEDLLRGVVPPQRIPTMQPEDMLCRKLQQKRVRCMKSVMCTQSGLH